MPAKSMKSLGSSNPKKNPRLALNAKRMKTILDADDNIVI